MKQAKKLGPKDYHTGVWTGGTTTQLLISPIGADYAARDFDWRISSALVEAEESIFTPLPDYNRVIMTFDRPISLKHGDGDFAKLMPFTPHAFDGAVQTYSRGSATDFNLMLRKDRCEGFLLPVHFKRKERIVLQNMLSDRPAYETVLMYVFSGSITCRTGDKTEWCLKEKELLFIPDDACNCTAECITGGDSTAVIAGILTY